MMCISDHRLRALGVCNRSFAEAASHLCVYWADMPNGEVCAPALDDRAPHNMQVPGVAAAAVVGLPHDRLGEQVFGLSPCTLYRNCLLDMCTLSMTLSSHEADNT